MFLDLVNSANILNESLEVSEPKPESNYLYTAFLNEKEIDNLQCGVEKLDGYRVEGEGHPNEKANRLWLECVSGYVYEFIKSQTDE